MALFMVKVLPSSSIGGACTSGFLGLTGISLGGLMGCFCIRFSGVSPPASSSSELSILDIGI
jgi:hypothetical protein